MKKTFEPRLSNEILLTSKISDEPPPAIFIWEFPNPGRDARGWETIYALSRVITCATVPERSEGLLVL